MFAHPLKAQAPEFDLSLAMSFEWGWHEIFFFFPKSFKPCATTVQTHTRWTYTHSSKDGKIHRLSTHVFFRLVSCYTAHVCQPNFFPFFDCSSLKLIFVWWLWQPLLFLIFTDVFQCLKKKKYLLIAKTVINMQCWWTYKSKHISKLK